MHLVKFSIVENIWMNYSHASILFTYLELFSVVTIFFATKLTKAELPDWLDWILVGYVAFHVAVHLILSVSPVCIKQFWKDIFVLMYSN
jgi:hypothetical protein